MPLSVTPTQMGKPHAGRGRGRTPEECCRLWSCRFGTTAGESTPIRSPEEQGRDRTRDRRRRPSAAPNSNSQLGKDEQCAFRRSLTCATVRWAWPGGRSRENWSPRRPGGRESEDPWRGGENNRGILMGGAHGDQACGSGRVCLSVLSKERHTQCAVV